MTAAAPRAGRSVVAAAVVGNALEWYDFSVYLLLAPYIAHNFFPGAGPSLDIVKALLVFGVGFAARPLGALLLGIYADVCGRKAALTATFALMSLGTAGIGLAPTYSQIGTAAPLLLLFGRLLQGFSAGGEIGGASALLVEQSPAGRHGATASWLQASMAISNILGALVTLGASLYFGEDGMAATGWRIPFLFGLLIVPAGLWFRRAIPSSPPFIEEGSAPNASLWSTLREQPRALIIGFGISTLWGASVYALVIFMPVYARTVLGFPAADTFKASIAGNVGMAALCFVSGHLADRWGARTLLTRAALALLVLPPALLALLSHGDPLSLVLVQTCFCMAVGLYAGAAPSVLAQLYPAPVRSTAVSIAYNGAVLLVAAFAPAIITALSTSAIGIQAPTVYVAVTALIALVAIRSLPATN